MNQHFTRITRRLVRQRWIFVVSSFVLAAPFQNLQSGQTNQPGANEKINAVQALARTVRQDLDRATYLADTVNRKIEAQDSAVCAGGKELDHFISTLHKLNTDYNQLVRKTAAEAPNLQQRVNEDALGASQIVNYVSDADLKSICAPAAAGTSAKAIAQMSITLQVTRKDVVAQRAKASEFERDAAR